MWHLHCTSVQERHTVVIDKTIEKHIKKQYLLAGVENNALGPRVGPWGCN